MGGRPVISLMRIAISGPSGVQGHCEVSWDRFDGDQPRFRFRIESRSDRGFNGAQHDEDCLDYGHDLKLASGAEPSHREAMAALLTFLLADAETYTRHMGPISSGDPYIFNERTAEWAYGNSEEIEQARLELVGDPDRVSNGGG